MNAGAAGAKSTGGAAMGSVVASKGERAKAAEKAKEKAEALAERNKTTPSSDGSA